jgi:hypothetical protein
MELQLPYSRVGGWEHGIEKGIQAGVQQGREKAFGMVKGKSNQNHLTPTKTDELIQFLVKGKKADSNRFKKGHTAVAAKMFMIHTSTVKRLWLKACKNFESFGKYTVPDHQIQRKYDQNSLLQATNGLPQEEEVHKLSLNTLAKKMSMPVSSLFYHKQELQMALYQREQGKKRPTRMW